MAISTVENPMTGDKVTIAKGVVQAISVKEIPAADRKTYSGKNGPWTPDKRQSVLIDEDWVSLGMTDKDEIRGKRKGTEKDYVALAKGMEVTAIVTISGDEGQWKNTKPSHITIVNEERAEHVAAATNAKASGGSTFNLEGTKTGHAINAAGILCNHKHTNEELLELAKELHVISSEVERAWQEANPSFRKGDVGAAAGNAVLNACHLLTKSKLGQVEATALSILEEVSAPMLAFVKSGGATPEVAGAPAKAPVATDTSADEADEDFDDDMPF